MKLLLCLMMAMQSPAWVASPNGASVGDTVRLVLQASADPGVRAVAVPLTATGAYTPLSAPIAEYSEGRVFVRYLLAFFESGRHALTMPDIELIHSDGTTDVILGDTAHVNIVSVLPASDTFPSPQPSLGPVARSPTNPYPLFMLLLMAVTCLTAWAGWRRRTGVRPEWSGHRYEPVEPPLQQWIRAGEAKAVVGAATDRIRKKIESWLPEAGRQLSTDECMAEIRANRADWPTRDIEDLLRSLDRAQYAPAIPSDVALLVDQVDDMVAQLDADGLEGETP